MCGRAVLALLALVQTYMCTYKYIYLHCAIALALAFKIDFVYKLQFSKNITRTKNPHKKQTHIHMNQGKMPKI